MYPDRAERRRDRRQSCRKTEPGGHAHGSALRVRLLGGLELRLNGRPLPPVESSRAEALLAFLLLHGPAAQPRQRLAFALWPDSTEAQARTNLRHVLHNLRRALPTSTGSWR